MLRPLRRQIGAFSIPYRIVKSVKIDPIALKQPNVNNQTGWRTPHSSPQPSRESLLGRLRKLPSQDTSDNFRLQPCTCRSPRMRAQDRIGRNCSFYECRVAQTQQSLVTSHSVALTTSENKSVNVRHGGTLRDTSAIICLLA